MPYRELFDRIIVISLRSSTGRRAHIASHFQVTGISDYEFHDACGIDDEEVAALYGSGAVAQYPPCFRCGQATCGRDDCNNVLIPPQVAVFASYLRLWRALAATNERVLICEDDVVFHPWWRHVLSCMLERIRSGGLCFDGAQPLLLRFGWALGADHDETIPFRVAKEVRMSNPCHAITSAYARQLLAQFDGVRHTVDVYQHSLASVSHDHAFTVFPPIASELSWSTGAMESLIHPKENHVVFLQNAGRHDEAESYRRRVAEHHARVAHRKPG